MMVARPAQQRQAQSGSSLIEALVSMLILSFAMMGLAGLLLSNTVQQKNSSNYIVANALTEDLVERMKSNPDDVALNSLANNGSDYVTPTAKPDDAKTSYTQAKSTTVTPVSCMIGTPCAVGAVARSDLSTWLARIRQELPGGVGVVTRPPGDDSNARQIVVAWLERSSDRTTKANETNLADAAVTNATNTIFCPDTLAAGEDASVKNGLRCLSIVMKP
jgi:type IV pilus assembly protein PilV